MQLKLNDTDTSKQLGSNSWWNETETKWSDAVPINCMILRQNMNLCIANALDETETIWNDVLK